MEYFLASKNLLKFLTPSNPVEVPSKIIVELLLQILYTNGSSQPNCLNTNVNL